MEEKNKNLVIYTRKVLRTPNTAVSISWKCTQNSWYTLHQLKKGYKTDDEQFQNGGNCVVLSFSLFQRLNRRTKLFDDSKFPIDSYSGYLDQEGGTGTTSRFSSEANNHATGGAINDVAIQQGRFSLNAAKEDRWTYTIQFIAKSRIGVDFTC